MDNSETLSNIGKTSKEDIPLITKSYKEPFWRYCAVKFRPKQMFFFNVFSFFSCWCSMFRKCCGPRELKPRKIMLGTQTPGQFPANAIRNQKYNIITFLPLVLYQQFKFFLNLYFLIMATSQFVPDIRISYLYTYWIPLVSLWCFL